MTCRSGCRCARSAPATGCRTRRRCRPPQGGAGRRAVADRRRADRGRVVRAPQGDPVDGRRRRGLGRGAAQPGRALLGAGAEPARAPSGRWRPGSTRSRSSCRRRTPTTARTSTGRPRSRSTTSPRSSTWRTAAGATVPGHRLDGLGLPLRGRRAGRAGALRRRPGAGRRRRHPVVRRHHRHGDADAGSPGWSARPGRPSRTPPLNLHFHNTRGTGLANVLAALELGVSDFDASVGGLGGCPYAPGATGNIATEELVHMVEDMGVATGVDLEAMIEVAAAGRDAWSAAPCPPRCCAPARAPAPSRPEPSGAWSCTTAESGGPRGP